jgi:hypothetical protein
MHPWKHDIPLAKEFSTIEEVVAAIGDNDVLERIARQARQDLACAPAHSYRAFAARCAPVIDEEYVLHDYIHPAAVPHTGQEFRRALTRSPADPVSSACGAAVPSVGPGIALAREVASFVARPPSACENATQTCLKADRAMKESLFQRILDAIASRLSMRACIKSLEAHGSALELMVSSCLEV